MGSWCCLIAVAGDHVLGWQRCDTEKKAAWAALLARFPAPTVVISINGVVSVVIFWPPTTRVKVWHCAARAPG